MGGGEYCRKVELRECELHTREYVRIRYRPFVIQGLDCQHFSVHRIANKLVTGLYINYTKFKMKFSILIHIYVFSILLCYVHFFVQSDDMEKTTFSFNTMEETAAPLHVHETLDGSFLHNTLFFNVATETKGKNPQFIGESSALSQPPQFSTTSPRVETDHNHSSCENITSCITVSDTYTRTDNGNIPSSSSNITADVPGIYDAGQLVDPLVGTRNNAHSSDMPSPPESDTTTTNMVEIDSTLESILDSTYDPISCPSFLQDLGETPQLFHDYLVGLDDEPLDAIFSSDA